MEAEQEKTEELLSSKSREQASIIINCIISAALSYIALGSTSYIIGKRRRNKPQTPLIDKRHLNRQRR